MLAQKLTSLLERNRIHYKALRHPPTYTAQDMASAMHVPGREIAKAVVLEVDGKFAVAVLPASRRVDLQRFREAAGAQSVSLAEEVEFRKLFLGCELGAEPPFGHLYGLPTWVDDSLAEDEFITFNGGSHEDAVRIRYEDFARLAQPKVARFARG